MPTIYLQPSPPSAAGVGADVSAEYLDSGFAPPLTNTQIYFGTLQFTTFRNMMWILWEIPLPAGAVFTGMYASVWLASQDGMANQEIMVGLLANDGVWNAGGETSKGWGEYTDIANLPHPNTPTDSAWLNSSATFVHTVNSVSIPTGAGRVRWGYQHFNLQFSDPQFLTDLQTAFDANESFRTSRGVPVAFAWVPTSATPVAVWGWWSQDISNGFVRPSLSVIYEGAPVNGNAELTSAASLDAKSEIGRIAGSELATPSIFDSAPIVGRLGASELAATSAIDSVIHRGMVGGSEIAGSSGMDSSIVTGKVSGSELIAASSLDAMTRREDVASSPCDVLVSDPNAILSVPSPSNATLQVPDRDATLKKGAANQTIVRT